MFEIKISNNIKKNQKNYEYSQLILTFKRFNKKLIYKNN